MTTGLAPSRSRYLSSRIAVRLGAALLALTALGGADIAMSAPAPTLSDRCQALVGTQLGGGARVHETKVVAADAGQPASCVAVAGFASSTLRFQASLPLEGWNGKMVFLGGGGFDGIFMKADEPYFSPSIRTERYATVTTNGGYDAGARDASYFQATFATDPDKLANFTHLSEHRSVAPARKLLASLYGTAPKRSYFEGCSMGGHDALILAQRYPQDFDGIVARAPAGNVVGLMLQFNRVSKLARQADAVPDAAQLARLSEAVLAQCDALDGIKDGLVSRPAACDFDPASLRCPAGGPKDGCFDEKQYALIEAVTTPLRTADHKWTHPGFPLTGTENSAKGWGEYILPQPALGGTTLQGLFSDGFVRSFIIGDPQHNIADWHPDAWLPRIGEIGAMFNATAPDLSAMHARGAKLILWNGTADSSVSMRDTVNYYDSVVAKMGRDAAGQTVELFLAPGVGHCSGGAGPDRIDLLQAMSRWVEQGQAPSRQKLEHRTVAADGTTIMSRPACPYPSYTRYRGNADPTQVDSFVCVRPGASAPR